MTLIGKRFVTALIMLTCFTPLGLNTIGILLIVILSTDLKKLQKIKNLFFK